ncbi:hypothetical protein NWE55_00850 [Myroides albus]|uniref:hypothetical protein n=1 Tax=Myroides albus TaxID=2562892 RepID=UPI00215945D3|nr:hypothetical protein [Myroides albus]UVD79871.1 hypothetical protein NWE55_00850 [Myroides albus]
MKQRVNILFFILFSIKMIGQVGIGVENPVVNFDINPKGIQVENPEDRYIRLEGLGRKPEYLRKIVLNQDGDLATMDYSSDNFNLKTIKYVKSKRTVHTGKSANVMDPSKDQITLEMDLEVTLSPNTDNILFLEYDVPIYIYNNKENNLIVVGYVGVTLTKVEEDTTLVELDQGSRKLTNYESKINSEGDVFLGVSITGKAIDQISNTETVNKVVKYKLYGYVEKGRYDNIDKEVYFGNANGEIESLGIGVFNGIIYEKIISTY